MKKTCPLVALYKFFILLVPLLEHVCFIEICTLEGTMVNFSWNIYYIHTTSGLIFSILFLPYDSTYVGIGTIVCINGLAPSLIHFISCLLVTFMFFCRFGATLGCKSSSHPEGGHTATPLDVLTLWYHALLQLCNNYLFRSCASFRFYIFISTSLACFFTCMYAYFAYQLTYVHYILGYVHAHQLLMWIAAQAVIIN